MTDDERAVLIEQLRQGPVLMAAELEGISNEDARRESAPEAWSVLDCVEHVAVVESALFRLISTASTAAEPGREAREDRFLRHIQKRSRKFQAPEELRPRGRFPTLADALQSFTERRERTVGYIEKAGDDLRGRMTTHPVAGEITCRECLALLIGHPLRHLDQIREIKLDQKS